MNVIIKSTYNIRVVPGPFLHGCLVQRSSVWKVKYGVKKTKWEMAWRWATSDSEWVCQKLKKERTRGSRWSFLTLRDCTMFLVLSCCWKLKPSPKNMSDKSMGEESWNPLLPSFSPSSPASSYNLRFFSSERISYASEINFHCVQECNLCMVGVVWARYVGGREGERHTKWHTMYTSLIPRPHRGHGVWQDAGCYLLWIVPLNTAWSDITGWSLHDTYMHP